MESEITVDSITGVESPINPASLLDEASLTFWFVDSVNWDKVSSDLADENTCWYKHKSWSLVKRVKLGCVLGFLNPDTFLDHLYLVLLSNVFFQDVP